MPSAQDGVAWTEHKRRRPPDSNWYLVATRKTWNYMPSVLIAWWEPGRGYGWQDFSDDRDESIQVLYWAPLPKMPLRLQKQRDRNFKERI